MKKPILIAAASTLALMAVAATAQARPGSDGHHLPGDSNGDRQLTRAEADIHASAKFSALAKTDGAPGISLEDFKAHKHHPGDQKGDRNGDQKANMDAKMRAKIGARFAAIDENMDGALTAEEFASAPRAHDRRAQKGPDDQFANADENKDGRLSPREFASIGKDRRAEMAEKHKAKREEHRSKLFSKLDSDGDGTITETEFLGHHSDRFDRADKDGDGILKGRELGAYAHHRGHAKKRDHMRGGAEAEVHVRGRAL